MTCENAHVFECLNWSNSQSWWANFLSTGKNEGIDEDWYEVMGKSS